MLWLKMFTAIVTMMIMMAFRISYVASSSVELQVEHSLGLTEEMSNRGVLVISPTAGKASFAMQGYDFSKADLQQLQALIEADGFYRISIPTAATQTDSEDGPSFSASNPTPSIIASVRACELRRAGFKEEIALHLNDAGQIVGVDYKVPVGPLAATRDCKKMGMPESARLQTTFRVVKPTAAQVIPLQAFAPYPPPGLTGLKGFETEKEKKDKLENKSFLAKYWMYIVPVVLLLMTTSPPPEGAAGAVEGGGGGGGGGGGAR